jgi:hypothetical protein
MGSALVIGTATAIVVDRGIDDYTRTGVPVAAISEEQMRSVLRHYERVSRVNIREEDYHSCVRNVIRDFGARAISEWQWTDSTNMAIHACKHAWDEGPTNALEYDYATIRGYLWEAHKALRLSGRRRGTISHGNRKVNITGTPFILITTKNLYKIISYYKTY